MTDTAPQLPAADGSTDPHQWLEDVTGTEALDRVRQCNAAAEDELDAVADPAHPDGAPLTETLQAEIREILDAKDRIPAVTVRGEFLYNVWTDAEHERGLWRRTTLESYRTDEPEWEILLDVDALNEAEGEDWVWHGARLLRPAEGEPYRHALIDLSHGGSDADVTREFDLSTLAFVPASEGGFVRPEAKGSLSWIDRDTVWAVTDFGEGTMTDSGYARQARIWRRGTPLEEAQPVHEVAATDMAVFAAHDSTPGWERDWVIEAHAFYDSTVHVVDRSQEPPVLTRVEVPSDLEATAHRDLGIFSPRSDWEVGEGVYPAGSLVVGDFARFQDGEPELHMLFEPTASTSLADMTITRTAVVLSVLEDVVHRLEVHTRDEHGQWVRRDLYPELRGALGVSAVDADVSDEVWVSVTGFVEPAQLLLGDLSEVAGGGEPGELELIKSAPARFDAEGLDVSQHFAISDDGTRVPYFEISRPDRVEAGEVQPTLLYGYGGFEISLTPSYLGAIGKAWLERGGTYVLANIRGGGEYGPAWHQAALRENRHRAYEDFSSVAKDLLERGVTDTAHLAVRGGSNGGLLTGNMLTTYPELFGAVVIQVPLLDMKRYSHLLAGASWMAEYGDPDTEDWEFLRTFSPYHLLAEGVDYPPTFVLTSTRDDRVHPGHARKFAAALESLGADVRSWENIEGGHGGAATNEQAARMNALLYAFLWNTIGRTR
ncbi:prolyl oligopeptidase family serine peptidase [Brachybacterium saurashtrense]|uniref:S9 family peptidase n=1 Tax=Brachybacterium saurashtrense TaxID=556288 RepID=A0A345YKF2_9MICO|nr:prolyl oligopeptidase family serine peptidase [Brachybacterium saurashtrense]AXK44404.1 S9 family peptidase [Brachybacterium saurashtrense]RRR23015.1 S9 family peptidase [Brachybacterium saurashtrense]